jgi:hypothetical protein
VGQFGLLADLQEELVAENASTRIRIGGINQIGAESGNNGIEAYGAIPYLQDTPEEGVWDRWEIAWRDVMILDELNRPVGVYNLLEHSLLTPEDRAELKQMLLDAAGE